MIFIQDLHQLKEPPAYPVAALGNFDGLHRGHRALVRQAVEQAKARGGTSVVLTFEPHPQKVLAPAVELRLLSSLDEKAGLLEQMGVDRIICVPFTASFAALSPEGFVEELLHQKIRVREVFVGEDFAFGKNRAGTVKDLDRLGRRLGFVVYSIQTIRIDGKPVSSSRIRELLLAGQVREAAGLLGRVYSLEGRVLPGRREGTSLGFPTANLKPPADRVIPADGVYAAWGVLKGNCRPGVAYIGTQPTLGPRERTIELHLFEPQPDLYQENVRVGFQDFIRGEEVFSDRKALIRQINEDVQQARARLTPVPEGVLMTLPEKPEKDDPAGAGARG